MKGKKMKESKHTMGPWRVGTGTVTRMDCETKTVCGQGIVIAEAPAYIQEERPVRDANAARIVACVNACEGLNPAAIPDLLAAAEEALALHGDSYTPDDWNSAGRALRTAIRAAKGGE